jgi:hypothetical protein
MELGFLRIIPGVSLAQNPNRDAVVTVSRSRAAIRFPDQLRALRAGDEVSRVFVLSSPVPSTAHRLAFFVSGDQRARAIPLLMTDFVLWKDLPIEYSVTVNGKVVSDGPIEQLSRPFFLEIPSSIFTSAGTSTSDDVFVELKLRCIKDISILPAIRAALAFEYPFYRDGSADSRSNNQPSEQASAIRIFKHVSSASR